MTTCRSDYRRTEPGGSEVCGRTATAIETGKPYQATPCLPPANHSICQQPSHPTKTDDGTESESTAGQ